jgi:hypothetical protein
MAGKLRWCFVGNMERPASPNRVRGGDEEDPKSPLCAAKD